MKEEHKIGQVVKYHLIIVFDCIKKKSLKTGIVYYIVTKELFLWKDGNMQVLTQKWPVEQNSLGIICDDNFNNFKA